MSFEIFSGEMLCFEDVDIKGNGCENEVEIPYSLLNTLA